MPAWLTVLCIVGGVAAFVAIGGVVHALVQRAEIEIEIEKFREPPPGETKAGGL